MKVAALTDSQLIGTLKALVAREHVAIADVVEHLAEVDVRKIYITEACASLTAYCQERLGYSQYEAAHRVTAARLVQQYPPILQMLRSGALCLSILRVLAPVLTASNHRERLEAAVGRTRNEVELLVAGWGPKPDVPTRVVPLTTQPAPMMFATPTAVTPAAPTPVESSPRPAPLPKPLTPERFKLQVTIDVETREDLMRLRDYLRHAIPDGDVAKILKRALKDLRSAVEARKFGKRKADKPPPERPQIAKRRTQSPQAEKPITVTGNPSSNTEQADLFAHVIDEGEAMPRAPGRATRRAVAQRDNYQCSYVSNDGHRCSSTAWLEYDHKLEHSRSGPTWRENLQLLCHAHHRSKHRDEPLLDHERHTIHEAPAPILSGLE